MKAIVSSPRSGIAPGPHLARIVLGTAGLLLTACQFVFAQSSGPSSYEPSSRQRLRAESCMKDEVDQGAMCVKRCDENFKLEANGRKFSCRATKSGATHVVLPPEYQPAPKLPNAPPPKAGY